MDQSFIGMGSFQCATNIFGMDEETTNHGGLSILAQEETPGRYPDPERQPFVVPTHWRSQQFGDLAYEVCFSADVQRSRQSIPYKIFQRDIVKHQAVQHDEPWIAQPLF